jgi:hypothetical protein
MFNVSQSGNGPPPPLAKLDESLIDKEYARLED